MRINVLNDTNNEKKKKQIKPIPLQLIAKQIGHLVEWF